VDELKQSLKQFSLIYTFMIQLVTIVLHFLVFFLRAEAETLLPLKSGCESPTNNKIFILYFLIPLYKIRALKVSAYQHTISVYLISSFLPVCACISNTQNDEKISLTIGHLPIRGRHKKRPHKIAKN